MGCTPTRLEPGMEVRVSFWPNATYFIRRISTDERGEDVLEMLDGSGTFVSRLYPQHITSIVTDADRAAQRYPADEPHPPTTTGTA